ncbi:protein XRP2-like [Tritrichomonas foetus]|uniref:Protein XRP2-like n=1 Tax=Tritrichomonas foetus TaxID=1144522 RepID=A0A1J4KG45_9EUKA|nr:protein XRP2-like [Tritrichomonas foetus]|eukprot:OHT10383.1 protein XRP2-like [Tritrichomonas foetus]
MGSSSSKTKSNKDSKKDDNVVEYTPPKIIPVQTGEKKDRSFYVQSQKDGETIKRIHGDLCGNPFNASQLTNCTVIIEDYCDSMNIDKCENTKFILSSIRGSIFVRTCISCQFIMVCGQFRCVDCKECDFLLFSKTGPVVESSTKIRIGCGFIGHETLIEDMTNAQLNPLVNKWTDVHDFTPAKGNFEIVDNLEADFYQQKIPALPYTISLKKSKTHFNVKVDKNHLDSVIKLSNENHIFVKIEESQNGKELNCLVEGQSKSSIQQIFNDLNPISITKRSA